MNNIICLDIDDCIFINSNTWIGETNDSFELLEINLKRLKLVLKKFNAKIFITSSWYSILKLENNNIIYNNSGYGLSGKSYYELEFKAFQLLSKYLNGYVIGLSSGSRKDDIKNLLLDLNNKVIALDDMELTHIRNQNYLFLYTNGFITNHILYNINNFFKE